MPELFNVSNQLLPKSRAMIAVVIAMATAAMVAPDAAQADAPPDGRAADNGVFFVLSPLRLEAGEYNRFVSKSAGAWEDGSLKPKPIVSASTAVAAGYRMGRIGVELGTGAGIGNGFIHMSAHLAGQYWVEPQWYVTLKGEVEGNSSTTTARGGVGAGKMLGARRTWLIEAGVGIGSAFYDDDGVLLGNRPDWRKTSTSLSIAGQVRLARAWGKFAPR